MVSRAKQWLRAPDGFSLETLRVRLAGFAQRRRGQLGYIDKPREDGPFAREALYVGGWALARRGTVSRVEIALDGRVAGRARIGLPRLGPASHKRLSISPAALLSGFEWNPAPDELPTDRDRFRVEARVTTTAGETFTLTRRRPLELSPPAPRFTDEDGEAARLRARTQAFVRAQPAAGRGMRVLAFAHRLDHGGAQRYFFEQIRYLMEDPDVSCTVVTPVDGVWRRRLEILGVDVLVAGFPTSGVVEYKGAVEQLAAWCSQRGFDAVFANTLDTFLGVDTAIRLGLPVAWSIHESFQLDHWFRVAFGGAGHPYARERLEVALGKASALIFAADATKRLFEPYADPERTVTAPYGLEVHDIDDFRQRFGASAAREVRSAFPEDVVLLLCLGTLIPRKAQAVLAQAFAQVSENHPTARLALVGDTGDDYSRAVRGYARASGLGGRCRVIPVTSDAYAWHEAADVFVLASDIESSPISILEAMAFETPVVASNVFGVPELIEDGVNGYLCEPNDVGDLARALDRVLRVGAQERRRVARAGAERVRSRHDPDRYARALRGLLAGLVHEPERLPRWSPHGGAQSHDRPAEPAPAVAAVGAGGS